MNTVILIETGAILFLAGFIVGATVARRKYQSLIDDMLTEGNDHLETIVRAFESELARLRPESSVIAEVVARRHDPARQS